MVPNVMHVKLTCTVFSISLSLSRLTKDLGSSFVVGAAAAGAAAGLESALLILLLRTALRLKLFGTTLLAEAWPEGLFVAFDREDATKARRQKSEGLCTIFQAEPELRPSIG